MFLFAVAPGADGRGGRCLPAGAEGMDRYHSPGNIGREEPRSCSSPQFVADSLLEQAGFEPSVPPHRGQLPKPRRRGRWKPPLLSKGANIEVVSFFRLVRNAGGYDRLLT